VAPVVQRLSRLARPFARVIGAIVEVGWRGIALKSLTRNIYTGTPEGRSFFHMTARSRDSDGSRSWKTPASPPGSSKPR